MRTWAVAHPHEFSLLYGSPVPDYAAPPATIAPAGRAVEALMAIVRAAAADGSLDPPVDPDAPIAPDLEGQLLGTVELMAPGVPRLAVARLFQALSQLVGVIGLELYGHLVGTFDPTAPFFEHSTTELAARIGLVDGAEAGAVE